MIWLLLATMLPSAVISWLACWLVRRYAVPIGLVDEPGHRKVHTRTTPLGGGIGIWLGVLLPFAAGQGVLAWLSQSASPREAWERATANAGVPMLPDLVLVHLDGLVNQMPKLWMLLAGGTILMMLGLLDDLKGLNWKLRIGVQIAVAAAIVASGVRATFYVEAAWVTVLISTLWIVGLVNSFNMLDNMDCLSGGVAAIAAAVLAAVLLLSPDPVLHRPQLFVGGYLLVLIGALLGFLWHNRPPARLFMGDAGSYFVGYSLATMTILATFTGGSLPPHAVLVPLCVLAVPLYDTITVVAIRLRAGRSPFEGDKSHFSHRLVELGMTKGQAVLTIYLTTATCGLCAFLLNQVNLAGAAIIVLVVLCMLCLVGILETVGRRKS